MQFSLDRWNDYWDRPNARRRAKIVLAALLVIAGIVTIVRAYEHSSEFPSFRRISRATLLAPGESGDVRIDGGRILLEAGDPWTALVCTREEFPESYELEFEGMTPDKWSGLPAVVFPVGGERGVYVIGACGGGETGLVGFDGLGMVLNGTMQRKFYWPGQWFRVRLRVTSTAIQAWVDKRKMLDLPTVGRAFEVWPSYDYARPLALVTRDINAYARNVRIRPIEPDGEWETLFDGRTLDGWEKVEEFPDRGDIYDVFGHKRAYPPFFAFAFAPFSWGPMGLGAVLFWLCNAAAIIFCPLLCVRAMWPPESEPRFGVTVLACMLLFGMMVNVMLRSETDLIILLCVCGGLYLMLKGGRPFLAGMLLGFVAAMKLTPCFLGVYLLWKRNWRALAGMVAGLVLFVGVLPSLVHGPEGNIHRHERWWNEVMVPYRHSGALGIITNPYRSINQSITAASCRFLTKMDAIGKEEEWFVNVAELTTAQARRIGRWAGVLLLVLLLPLWWGKGPAEPPIVRGLQYSAALIAMLELSEVSLTSHHVMLLVPVAAGLVFLSACKATALERLVVGWGLAVSLALLAVCVVPQLKALSPVLFATIVQYAVIVWLLVRYRLASIRRGLPNPP